MNDYVAVTRFALYFLVSSTQCPDEKKLLAIEGVIDDSHRFSEITRATSICVILSYFLESSSSAFTTKPKAFSSPNNLLDGQLPKYT